MAEGLLGLLGLSNCGGGEENAMDNADMQKLLHLARLAVALHGPDWTAPIELVKGQWWYVPKQRQSVVMLMARTR